MKIMKVFMWIEVTVLWTLCICGVIFKGSNFAITGVLALLVTVGAYCFNTLMGVEEED